MGLSIPTSITVVATNKFIFPSLEYCTDNGAMIALTAYYYFKNNISSNLSLAPNPNLCRRAWRSMTSHYVLKTTYLQHDCG